MGKYEEVLKEVDGSFHELKRKHDEERDRYLITKYGYKSVIHVPTNKVRSICISEGVVKIG